MLSPLYDKLFDRGFITFTEDRRLILSEFISPYTWRRIGLKNNIFIKALVMDEKRAEYLQFHHESVFKGSFDSRIINESTKYVPGVVSMVAEESSQYISSNKKQNEKV